MSTLLGRDELAACDSVWFAFKLVKLVFVCVFVFGFVVVVGYFFAQVIR